MKTRRKRVLMALGYNDYQLHRGIVTYAKEAGWILDSSMAYYGKAPEYWQGDGILTLLVSRRADLLEFLASHRVATVSLTADVPELAVPRVLLENRKIGVMGAEHLLERGFRRLAFYQHNALEDVREREEGFRRRVAEAGGNYYPLNWQSRQNQDIDWLEWIQSELQRIPRPFGLMAQSDNRAVHLISACEAAGLRVPEEVAVVGVDNNIHACEFASVPISSVESCRVELAYQGAALLDRLMAGEAPPAKAIQIAPRGVVTRQSSDILTIPHPEVAAALRYIWGHFQEGITVEDVVAQSATSRCGLYTAFKEHVGRGIAEEILRLRMERAKKLLGTSGEKLPALAQRCGFSGAEHLCRAFRRLEGLSPHQFRRQASRSGG